jgi:hypothetical protein
MAIFPRDLLAGQDGVPRVLSLHRSTRRWAAFSDDLTPKYLIYGNDSIHSDRVPEALESTGMEPKRSPFRVPWLNGTGERSVGSRKREVINHVIVFNQDHMRLLLLDQFSCNDEERVHTVLGNFSKGANREPNRTAKLCNRANTGCRVLNAGNPQSPVRIRQGVPPKPRGIAGSSQAVPLCVREVSATADEMAERVEFELAVLLY